MKLKKVNVLLSSYNGEKYIREQLRSLMEQEYENYQIHIRDDGSSDDIFILYRREAILWV